MNNILKDIEKNFSNEIMNLQINNQYVWPIVRYSIRKYLFDKMHNQKNYISKKEKFKIGLGLLLQIFKNLKYKNADYLYTLLENIDRNDEIYGDIYTYPLKKYLNNYNIILRPSVKGNLTKCINSNIYNISFGYILFLVKSLYYNKIDILQNNFINKICEIYKINSNYIYSDINKYFIFYQYFDKLIIKLNIKKLFFYCGYNITNLALIKCANEHGIKTIEIQHGNFTEYDYNYHYFHEYFKEFDVFFANTFLCFNKKFKNMLIKDNSYFLNKNIIQIGFPVAHTLKKIEHKDCKKLKILIIPTVNFNNDFIKVVSSLIELKGKYADIEIAIRFHPNILNKDLIQYIEKEYNNKIKVDNKPWRESILLYDYFIGEYSTTLLEAEYIGKKVLLINTPIAQKSELILEDPKYIQDFTKDTFSQYNWDFENVLQKNREIEILFKMDKL